MLQHPASCLPGLGDRFTDSRVVVVVVAVALTLVVLWFTYFIPFVRLALLLCAAAEACEWSCEWSSGPVVGLSRESVEHGCVRSGVTLVALWVPR